MCIDRWRKFKPTEGYLSVVKQLDTVEKLHTYMRTFKYKPDTIKILFWKLIWDYWQTPIETLKKGTGDCEDMARFAIDVLVRVLKILDARFISYTGKDIRRGHAVTVFPYQGNNIHLKGKLTVFSNNDLIYSDSYLDIGHLFFEEGLKCMVIRDWQGKVLTRKWKVFGTS